MTREEEKYFESSVARVFFFLSKVHTLHASFVKNKKFSGGTSNLGGGTGASAAATVPATDFCGHEPCMMHGKCVSRQDRYECHCYARYSGNNCQIDNGRPRRYFEHAWFTAYVGRADLYSTRALNSNVTSRNYAVTGRHRPGFVPSFTKTFHMK